MVAEKLSVGDKLPDLELNPVSRHSLALYCGASGDHNPIHVDSDVAKASGLDDVIAHGMLVMAYAGRFLTNWKPQAQLRNFAVRFAAMTKVHDVLTTSGEIIELLDIAGEPCAKIQLRVANQLGESKLVGDAVVAL